MTRRTIIFLHIFLELELLKQYDIDLVSSSSGPALGAGKRGRRPGPPNFKGPHPKYVHYRCIVYSYMYIWPVQGPRSKQFCIWRPREAIPSRQVGQHTRTRETRLLKPRVLVRGGDARCNRAAGWRRRVNQGSPEGGNATYDHPRC